MLRQSSYVTLNDYEAALLQSRSGQTVQQLSREVDATGSSPGGRGADFTLTARPFTFRLRGARGGRPHRLRHHSAPDCSMHARGLDWETTGRLASPHGCYKDRKPGARTMRPPCGDGMRDFSSLLAILCNPELIMKKIVVILLAASTTVLLSGCPAGLGSKDYSREQDARAESGNGTVDSVAWSRSREPRAWSALPGRGRRWRGRSTVGGGSGQIAVATGGACLRLGRGSAEETITARCVEITVKLDSAI